jgi:predicted DNA-binding transcriptional regulator YafY
MKTADRDALLGLLSQGRHWTAQALAEQLGRSLRSVRRGLAQLREEGVVLDSEPGRGGGVRLARRSAIPRLALSHREAITLLMGLATAETCGAPLLAPELRSLRHKLSAMLPADVQRRRDSLRERILLGRAASDAVRASWRPPTPAALAAAQDALFARRLLQIDYEDGGGRRSRRCIEPQYLLISAPAWYLLAWDLERAAARCFRLDRLRRAEVLTEGFSPRPATQLMQDVGQYFATL